MAGDELHSDASFHATRVITIAGSPEEVWPWLLQMGCGRAGFYGYDLLENLGSPTGIRSADKILPEFQDFRVGDEVSISAVAKMTFHAIEPIRPRHPGRDPVSSARKRRAPRTVRRKRDIQPG
jgi:hypothetical protein